MTILCLYAEDYPWDVRVEKLLSGFLAAGHDAHLLCRNLKRSSSVEIVDGITCHRVLGPEAPGFVHQSVTLPAPWNPVWRRALRQVIAEVRPDLVMVRDLPLATLAIAEARRHGLPVLVDMAENHPAMWCNVMANDPLPLRSWLLKNPDLARRLERDVARRADAIFVVVEEMKAHLIATGAPAERVHIVSNTPRLGLQAAARPETDGASLEMIYVGNVTRSRGLQQVLEAMNCAGADAPPLRFHVVGSGDYLPRLREISARLGLSDRVVFHGWIPNARVPEIIARCNVGVIPHLRTEHTDTTVPNKLFDFMALGLAVVVSDAAPMRRIVESEGCGCVFGTGDPESLSRCLAVLADPVLRRKLGECGRAAVQARYNWELDLKLALDVVADLTGG